MKAVIDRFEGDIAVIVLESGEIIHVPRQQLPSGGFEGCHVQVVFDDDQSIQSIQLDQTTTENAHKRIQEKLERLRRNEHLKED